MSSRHFSVETRSQAALIVGEGNPLTPHLISELKNRGIYGVTPSDPSALQALSHTHDLDYLILLTPFNIPPDLIPPLQSLLQSSVTRLIVAHHVNTPLPDLPLGPLALELVYCDYLDSATLLESPILSAWLPDILSSRSLTIPGDGLAEIGLLSTADLARGIAGAITTPHTTKASRVLLSSIAPLSILNLAYALRTALPYKISLNFAPNQSTPVSLADLTVPAFSWDQTSNPTSLLAALVDSLPRGEVKPSSKAVSEPVSTINHQPLAIKPISRPPRLSRLDPQPVFVPLVTPRPHISIPSLFLRLHSKRTPPTATNSHQLPKIYSIITRGLLLAIALYLSSLAFAATITALSLRSLASSSSPTALPTVSTLARPAATFLEANLVVISLIPGLGDSRPLTDSLLLLDSYQRFLLALNTAHSVSDTTGSLLRHILGAGEGDLVKLISSARLDTEDLYQQLSLLGGALPTSPPTLIPARYHDNYSAAKTELFDLKRSVLMTKAILSTLPDLIGVGGRRKYGILFQNNMELRGTGGFIGSFAILSFDNGVLYDMPVYDVYAADGQLKGHVEPPKPIKDILGEANWYLRDSNFDPDFPTSARRAEWFIQKTLNQELDGTIAVNLHSLSDLLRATGPLTVPDYNETISADNLYERAQYHAEVNFFPGSTQKKEFLSSVGNALFTQLGALASNSGNGLAIAQALLRSIEQKNTLISVTHPGTEHVLSTLNWNGSILSQPDSTMVVDSNFGVNKANYFVRRDTQVVITLAKDLSFNHVLRLRYTNTSTSNSWPAGAYKNYSRFYLPPGSLIRGFKVGDKELSTSDYTLSSEHNRTVVSYLLNVPINTALGVELEYQVPGKLSGNSPQYSWYWQKQPGTASSEPLTVYLNYPLYLKPQLVAPVATTGVQQLKFDFTNDTDHRLTVNFTQ